MSFPDVRSSESTFWKGVELVAVICFLATLAVMFIQVISRYAIGAAVPWTDETARFLFIAAIFLGAALCQLKGSQVRVTIVLDLFSERKRRWLDIVQAVFTAIVMAALFAGCIEMAINSVHLKAATLPITFAWLYAVQGIGVLLILLLSLRKTVRLFRSTTNERAPE